MNRQKKTIKKSLKNISKSPPKATSEGDELQNQLKTASEPLPGTLLSLPGRIWIDFGVPGEGLGEDF